MKKWTKKEYIEWLQKLKEERYSDEDGTFNFNEDEWSLMDFIELLQKENDNYEKTLKELYLNNHSMNDVEISDLCLKTLKDN